MNHDQIISEFQASMKVDSQAIQDKLRISLNVTGDFKKA